MNLRRMAQTNNAAIQSGTPTRAQPASPPNESYSPTGPSTPRNRVSVGVYRSPAATPSISSSIPFHWDAARSMKPPPFATPPQNRNRGRGPRQSMGVGSPAIGTPARRGFIKKKGFFQKLADIPSTIAFEMSQFPQNVPLPAPTTSASIIGGSMHLLHMFIRISQIRKVPDADLGWEDMYREGEGESWFDWTTPVSGLLIFLSFLNALHLFTRIKLYRLFKRQDPVSSPHANFVAAQLDHEPLEIPSLFSRMISSAWYSFSCSWRFLLGMKPLRSPITPKRTARVQQLEMWVPGELEMMLFSVYSPAHSLLWTATDSSNWIRMFLVMGLVGAQLRLLTHSYNALIKDKDIVAAEVMHEYNEGFVYPRINPIRKDVAVMTHQSEVVNIWED